METRAQMDFLARCRVGEVESGDRFSYYSRDTPLTERASPLSRVRSDYGHSHAVAQRGENANEKIARHVFEIVVQNGSHPGSRSACAPRDLRVSDLLPADDFL